MNDSLLAVLIALIAAAPGIYAIIAQRRRTRSEATHQNAQARNLDAQTADLIIKRMRGEYDRQEQELNATRMKYYRLVNAYGFVARYAPAEALEKAGQLLRGEDVDDITPILRSPDE